MQKITFDRLQKSKKAPAHKWQGQALEAIQKLVDGSKHKPSIFKCFKINAHKAQIALNDSMELEKPYSMYFFKVFNSLVKN